MIHDRSAVSLARLWAKVHGARTKPANLHAGTSERCVFHVSLLSRHGYMIIDDDCTILQENSGGYFICCVNCGLRPQFTELSPLQFQKQIRL